MSNIGKVDSLWRYPIKSMRGEELDEAFVGFSGIYGDRIFAFRSSASPKGFPYLTAREQRKLLRYRPRFRYPDKAARPINLADAEGIAPGLNPVSADTPDLMVDVEAPTGETLAIDGRRGHQQPDRRPGSIPPQERTQTVPRSINPRHGRTWLSSDRQGWR